MWAWAEKDCWCREAEATQAGQEKSDGLIRPGSYSGWFPRWEHTLTYPNNTLRQGKKDTQVEVCVCVCLSDSLLLPFVWWFWVLEKGYLHIALRLCVRLLQRQRLRRGCSFCRSSRYLRLHLIEKKRKAWKGSRGKANREEEEKRKKGSRVKRQLRNVVLDLLSA